MNSILYDIEEAFDGLFKNYPIAPIALLGRAVVFPFGRCYSKPTDEMTRHASDLITKSSSLRQLLQQNLYFVKDKEHMNRTSFLVSMLEKAVEVDEIYTKLRKEKRQATASEQKLIEEVEAARESIIQVGYVSRMTVLVSL